MNPVTLLPQRWLPRRWRSLPPLQPAMWQDIVERHPFLARLDARDQDRLRLLSRHFLLEKEFHGAHGLGVTDDMALTVAAQACLPLLHIRAPSGRRAIDPTDALDWYDDFVGIVIQPGAALARRRHADEAGVVHQYEEALAGEAMDRGPVMLSWEDVRAAAHTAEQGHNLVIHEFVHKIDMRGMQAGDSPDGAPVLRPDGGPDLATPSREHWRQTMTEAYGHFREQLSLAERFGGARPWLDPYAASHPAEFFSVTCEAYFVNRTRFAKEFPTLLALYDGFFRANV
jgi:MtfA peptidase